MNGLAEIIDPKGARELARHRPEMFTLVLVVAMFLGFLSFAGARLVDALNRNTTALEALAHLVDTRK